MVEDKQSNIYSYKYQSRLHALAVSISVVALVTSCLPQQKVC